MACVSSIRQEYTKKPKNKVDICLSAPLLPVFIMILEVAPLRNDAIPSPSQSLRFFSPQVFLFPVYFFFSSILPWRIRCSHLYFCFVLFCYYDVVNVLKPSTLNDFGDFTGVSSLTLTLLQISEIFWASCSKSAFQMFLFKIVAHAKVHNSLP